MNARVECLHAATEHLRKARELLDSCDGEPGVGERGRGPSARDELEPEVGEAAGERHEAGLVVNRKKSSHPSVGTRLASPSAHSVRTTSGRSRCSTACTRSRNVSTVSPARTGTGSLAMTGPVSIPAST